MTEIRDLTEPYVAECAQIDAAVFPESPWGEESFSGNVKNPFDFPVAAFTDGKMTGYGILRLLDDGEILLVGVEPGERRKGTGGKILDALLRKAPSGTKIFLEVRDSNTAARKLYESRGFREISRRKKYYRDPEEDAVIMMVENA